jgi:hypothetical protein
MTRGPLTIESAAYLELIANADYQQGLRRIHRVLRKAEFEKVARLPAFTDRFAFPKLPSRLLNVFSGRENVILNYDAFPELLRPVFRWREPEAFDLFQMLVLNEPCSRSRLLRHFLPEDVDYFVEHRLLLGAGGREEPRYVFTTSFYPFEDMILVRDSAYLYRPHEGIRGRVWVGSDTAACARRLAARVRRESFGRGLEIGVGSGTLMLCVAPHCDEFVGTDINERALTFSRVNADLNGRSNVRLLHSDLYENLDPPFDLIIANPYYCDLESGGLEEIPGLLDGLDAFLSAEGVAFLYVNSYVMHGLDLIQSLMREKFGPLRYALTLETVGYSVERERLSEYPRYGLSHIVSYLIEMRKGAGPSFEVKPPSAARRVRDRAYIAMARGLHRTRGPQRAREP